MIIQLAIVCQKTLKRPKTYMKNEYGKYCPGEAVYGGFSNNDGTDNCFNKINKK